MFFRCSGKDLRNFKIGYLILKGLILKSFKKCYSKSDPQTLSKKWSTNFTQKVVHKRYSKSDPKLLLKNWPTNFTQKVIHNCYSKTGPQTLFKNWSRKVTQKNGLQTLLIFLTLDNITVHLIFKRTPHRSAF